MFILHAGAVYRQALTPEQKKLKKKYLLEQQVTEDRIPTFEEVWEELEDSDGITHSMESYGENEVEVTDEDVLDWLQAHDYDLGEEPDSLRGEPYDEYIDRLEVYRDSLSELIEKHRDVVSEEASEAQAEELAKADLEDLYNEAVWRVESGLDGEECWRTILLPVTVDPTQHSGIGIYWAYEEDAAEAHWGGRGGRKVEKQKVTFHGRIDEKYIDKIGTVLANCDLDIGEMEKEVRFHSGAPIYIYDVQLQDRTILDIDDWRTT